ncbi:hypothetical protein SLS56_009326 [Neofusicoccum ribis]|uniref:Protein kinase domain-containing protein n=1 Tax=Neofusicoccum ribis TaxID=45134 RepID=A0ABR3SHQ1_9PEZI
MKREDAVKEVEHLQRLSHAHIVRLIGTYIIEDGKNFYILMYPVVDFDLERFLEKISDAAEDGAPQDFLAAADASLKSFFSCLVATLDFLQKRNVKHMDIKPKNILVRDVRQSILAHDCAYKVYLADFGIARAYSSPTESETTSPTAFTRLYSAPEVVAQETRGFKADVFSLGCVYAEMLATLARQRDQLDTTRQRSFQAEIPAVQQFLRELVFQEPEVYLWNTRSRAMISQLPKDRPSAKNIMDSIRDHKSYCCDQGSEPLESAKETEHQW